MNFNPVVFLPLGQMAALTLFGWQGLSFLGKLKYGKSIASTTMFLIAFAASGFIYLTFLR